MKSDTIRIDNRENGFQEAIEECRKVAAYKGLETKSSLHLQLAAEEMLSMIRSVTGDVKADFWIEYDEAGTELHLTTKPVLDKEKRMQLIDASTDRKNAAASSFLGRLRDAFENAMLADTNENIDLPKDILADLPQGVLGEADWDGYERSVLKKLAKQIKVGIVRGVVDMTVCMDI